MATTVTECGNVRIVTQVIQQKDPLAAEAIREPTSSPTASQLTSSQPKNFINTLPKALGVVQIVLGATQISFGIALTVAQEDFKKLTVNSGVYFWIGILLLLSGASLVEMEKRDYSWLEKLCLFVNLLVSGASVIAIILHGTEIGKETLKEDPCDEMDRYYCSNAGKILLYGLNSVFIILSLLELAMSLTAVVVIIKSSRQKFYRQMVST